MRGEGQGWSGAEATLEVDGRLVVLVVYGQVHALGRELAHRVLLGLGRGEAPVLGRLAEGSRAPLRVHLVRVRVRIRERVRVRARVGARVRVRDRG